MLCLCARQCVCVRAEYILYILIKLRSCFEQCVCVCVLVSVCVVYGAKDAHAYAARANTSEKKIICLLLASHRGRVFVC